MKKMIKINLVKRSFLILLAFVGASLGYAQIQTYRSLEISKIVIKGTSSLHDWQMEAKSFTSQIFVLQSSSSSLELAKINFELPVSSLKSEHSKMDANAYEALKSDRFPNILFESNENQHLTIDAGKINGIISGFIEIAGVKKEIQLQVRGIQDDSNNFSFEFDYFVHLEDFSIKPPSFMFGAVTTGSDVQVQTELYFNKLNN